MNWKKHTVFIIAIASTLLAATGLVLLPGLLTGSWLLFSLWGLIYHIWRFTSVDVNQWHSSKNMLRLLSGLALSFLLTGVLFSLAFSGSRFFWKDPGNNSRHHFLVHEGFTSSSAFPIYITGNMYNDVQAGLEGEISLSSTGNQFTLSCRKIPYPLYISRQADEHIWHLQQSGLPALTGEQILRIQMPGTTTTDEISVKALPKEKNQFDFRIVYKGIIDTVDNKTIAYGTRFSDLLENTNLPLNYEVIQSLQRLYLLKTNIQFISNKNYSSPVCWYYGKDPTYQYWQTKLVVPEPSMLQLASTQATYDLLSLQYQDKTISLGDKDRFYFGYEPAAGKQFLSQPAFSAELTGSNQFALKYLQPQIFPLPDTRGKNHELFITTHNRFALQRAGNTGYILPAINFERTDSNSNHFWADLQYSTGAAGDSITNARLRMQELQLIRSDKEFSALPPSPSHTGWLLKLHNSWVSAGSDVMNTLLPAIIVALASIGFIFLYSKKYSDENNSGTPVFFWWMLNILLYFFMLRLFLSWRVRSYPYTEAITKNEYTDFIEKSYLKTSFIGISISTNLLIGLLISAALGAFLVFQFMKRSKN
ncbi:hypothetical protein LZZ85_16215 [Terrimonas sp. NA20]|uniref:ResB-like domain-containing protein n=1 Tax=Terrimonas ginsenosidimutans TaxID=2908004 RepID=A0ABS9KU28_9BACT|nr:hypothetical protein [Terrimonas ginsenosidimutans]MCG2615841.1 hypothetical protein [Terrimonas ginsenosidimutans]